MKKTVITALLFLIALSESNAQKIKGFQNVDPISVGFSADRLDRLDQWMSSEIAENGMAGATVLISRKGKLVYAKSFGKSNIETERDMTTSDLFKIASMSKVITSVAILQMYEQGLFLLDDPISKYLPVLKDMEVLSSFNENDSTFQTVPSSQLITIRHLLTHTSGFSYGGDEISKIKAKQRFGDISIFGNTLEQFVIALSKIPLSHQPGASWSYGYSTDILGYLIEQVSGQPLSEYLDDNIFSPIGMSSTGFNIPTNQYSRYAQLYRSQRGELTPIQSPDHRLPENKEITLFMGGSGLISTAEDYMRFAQMLLNGGTFNGKQIVGKKIIELMSSNQIGSLNYPDEMLRLLGEANKFGLGVNVVTELGSINELYSAGSYYWEGMYSTSFIVDPKEELVAVFMTQTGTREPIRAKFRLMVYQALNK
tara:strand:- start:1738 stop:3012 length:1275 start_codon:yes stop_codon:yes gene_type:complete